MWKDSVRVTKFHFHLDVQFRWKFSGQNPLLLVMQNTSLCGESADSEGNGVTQDINVSSARTFGQCDK